LDLVVDRPQEALGPGGFVAEQQVCLPIVDPRFNAIVDYRVRALIDEQKRRAGDQKSQQQTEQNEARRLGSGQPDRNRLAQAVSLNM
jgi:hypothetical protein